MFNHFYYEARLILEMKKKVIICKKFVRMKRAHTIMLEMLQQRKYKVTEDEDTQILATKPNGDPVVVFFSDTPKFNVKSIQMYISNMNELKVFHSIIVYKNGITAFTKKAIAQSVEMTFELFSQQDLQYNVTKHRLQPQFIKLPPEEAVEFKKQYGSRFGVIRGDDPVSRFYAYNRGDVIRVIRGSGPTEFVTYRIVHG